jgi:hypothetical protein
LSYTAGEERTCKNIIRDSHPAGKMIKRIIILFLLSSLTSCLGLPSFANKQSNLEAYVVANYAR